MMTTRDTTQEVTENPEHQDTRSIGAYVDAAVPVAGLADTAGTVVARLAEHHFAAVDPIFVLGDGRALLGAAPLPILLATAATTPIEQLMDRN